MRSRRGAVFIVDSRAVSARFNYDFLSIAMWIRWSSWIW